MTVTVVDLVDGPYTLSGGADVLPYSFLVFTPSEIQVVIVAANGTETIVSDALYTVSINTDPSGNVTEGGTVTYTGTAGANVLLKANPAMTQEQVFSLGGFRPPSLNEMADRSALRDLIIDGKASNASEALGIAQEALAAVLAVSTSGTPIEPFTSDGTTPTFTLPVAVAGGLERTVKIFVAGVAQPPTAFSCDGTTTATWAGIPVAGADVEGFVEVVGAAVTINPTAVPSIGGGRLLTADQRAARYVDAYDQANVYKNGVTNDGPGLKAVVTSAKVVGHSSGIIRVLANETLPDYFDLDITGGQIWIADGVTLTVPSTATVRAPKWANVFLSTGEVRGLTEAWASWFGAYGDYDEAVADGADPTDVGAMINRAIRASQKTYLLDQAYATTVPLLLKPWLGQPQGLIGAGVSTAGGGTRIYPIGGETAVYVKGEFSDTAAICEYTVKDFSIIKTAAAGTNGLLVAGDGGANADGSNDKRLTGLVHNVIENVHATEFDQCFEVRSATRVILRNCTAISNTNPVAKGLLITRSPGGAQTTEIDIDGCTFAPPQFSGVGGGFGVRIINSETNGTDPEISEVRGITFMNNSQAYAGVAAASDGGVTYDLYCESDADHLRTMGDVAWTPDCKVQGDALTPTKPFTARAALRVRARNGGLISALDFRPIQVEGFAGDAITLAVSRSSGAFPFGEIRDVDIDTTFRYCVERSVNADGVVGLSLTGKQQFCGLSTATATEHVLLTNCVSSTVEKMKTSAKDATWVGLAGGLKVTGASTKDVRSRANAMGTTTAFTYTAFGADPNSGDSADQPSILAQV